MFPVQSTTIQVSMLLTLNLFVDKLALLKINGSQMTVQDKEMLNLVCDTFNKILRHCLGMYFIILEIRMKYNVCYIKLL